MMPRSGLWSLPLEKKRHKCGDGVSHGGWQGRYCIRTPGKTIFRYVWKSYIPVRTESTIFIQPGLRILIPPGLAPPTSAASDGNSSRAGTSHISSIRWQFLQGRPLPHRQHPMTISPEPAPHTSAASDDNYSRAGTSYIGSIRWQFLQSQPRTHRQHPMTITPGQAPHTSAASDGNSSRAGSSHISSIQ